MAPRCIIPGDIHSSFAFNFPIPMAKHAGMENSSVSVVPGSLDGGASVQAVVMSLVIQQAIIIQNFVAQNWWELCDWRFQGQSGGGRICADRRHSGLSLCVHSSRYLVLSLEILYVHCWVAYVKYILK